MNNLCDVKIIICVINTHQHKSHKKTLNNKINTKLLQEHHLPRLYEIACLKSI